MSKENKKDDRNKIQASRNLLDKPKVLSMKDLTQNVDEKKHELLMKKIDLKAQAILEKFKHSTPLSSQLAEQERIRQRIRENFFYSLVFGLEECKYKHQHGENEEIKEHIVEVSKLLMKDEKSQIEYIKNITLSIEANLYHKYNKEVGHSSAYSNRSRLVGQRLSRYS